MAPTMGEPLMPPNQQLPVAWSATPYVAVDISKLSGYPTNKPLPEWLDREVDMWLAKNHTERAQHEHVSVPALFLQELLFKPS